MELRSQLLLEYSSLLFTTEQTWEIAADYLLETSDPNAQIILEEHVGALDWRGCTVKANRLLALCDRYGIANAKQDLLRSLTYKYT